MVSDKNFFFVATGRALENVILGKKYFKQNYCEMFFSLFIVSLVGI